MVNVSKETTIILDKYVNTALFDCYGGATVLNVFVKNCNLAHSLLNIGLSEMVNISYIIKQAI